MSHTSYIITIDPSLTAALGIPITRDSASKIVTGSHTVNSDHPLATFSNLVFSFNAGGLLIVSSQALATQSLPPTAVSTRSYKVLTISSETIIVFSNQAIVSGKTFGAGSPGFTLDGTPISLLNSDVVVVGTSTEFVVSSPNLADLTMSAFDTSTSIVSLANPTNTPANGSSPTPFLRASNRYSSIPWVLLVLLPLYISVIMYMADLQNGFMLYDVVR